MTCTCGSLTLKDLPTLVALGCGLCLWCRKPFISAWARTDVAGELDICDECWPTIRISSDRARKNFEARHGHKLVPLRRPKIIRPRRPTTSRRRNKENPTTGGPR